MKLTDEAVTKAAWVIAEGNSRAWLTYSDDTRAHIARSWEPTVRAAIATALPDLEGATPSRKAFDVGYNIVNQLADLWEVSVEVRQATNDRCWEFAGRLIEGATPAIDREALESHLTSTLIAADDLVTPGYSARIEADADDIARVVTAAMLARFGDAS